MTVILTGRDLRRDEVVRVARLGEPVELHDDARARMLATRAVVEERLASGDPVYGLSTAVGVLKRVEVGPAEAAAYANRILRQHQVAQGEPAPAPARPGNDALPGQRVRGGLPGRPAGARRSTHRRR